MLTRIGPGHIPAIDHPITEQHAAGDVAAMQWLQLDRERLAENRAATLLDQPDPRRRDEDRDGDDAVELKLGEQKHPLDEAVVGRTRAAQDESEDGAENKIEPAS